MWRGLETQRKGSLQTSPLLHTQGYIYINILHTWSYIILVVLDIFVAYATGEGWKRESHIFCGLSHNGYHCSDELVLAYGDGPWPTSHCFPDSAIYIIYHDILIIYIYVVCKIWCVLMCLMINCYQVAWKSSSLRSKYVNVKNSNDTPKGWPVVDVTWKVNQIVAAGNIVAIAIENNRLQLTYLYDKYIQYIWYIEKMCFP